jgi:hypothetical protein
MARKYDYEGLTHRAGGIQNSRLTESIIRRELNLAGGFLRRGTINVVVNVEKYGS